MWLQPGFCCLNWSSPPAVQYNQHPHIHVSVTCSGLDVKNGVCHELFFRKKAVEEIWCGAMTRLLHHRCGLINPGSHQGGAHPR
ncbi:hypothetical protein DQD18_15095 [Salmonella enterica subsp. enterica serovar Oranienburg]|nr:hypothetical protein [Salmonella enterica subsp. enterica serovar Oranienburg]ECW6486545.1 hypothetical protein [Salmonella enterica subsp. enterica serovar Rubislaw]EDQ2493178.1 hypothetical protein [Salmonella enterica subsp. enterica serovar Bonariensis]EEA7823333.1 hypothetical protein [Salmonella enterica subsp. enterica serovar Miami]EBV1656908.1 hypothetical protein [Salmonella enterica subsp. enterica serovar Oranienburg]